MTARDYSKWVAIGVTIALTLLTVTAQWGVVNANLENMEKRLSIIEMELKNIQKIYIGAEKRISYLEGLRDRDGGK